MSSVIGQERTKKKLAVRGLQPLQADRDPEAAAEPERHRADEVEHPADRSDGNGKTLLAQTLAKLLRPLTIVDATTLTEAGYVGEDVENIILRLLQAPAATSRVPARIIYIDEVDKMPQGRRIRRSLATFGRGRPAGASQDPQGTVATSRRKGGGAPAPGNSSRSTRPTSSSSAAARSSVSTSRSIARREEDAEASGPT